MRFLVDEESATAPLQRAFFVEIAAEVVRRIDEDMPETG
jgi:hypothetical protein